MYENRKTIIYIIEQTLIENTLLCKQHIYVIGVFCILISYKTKKYVSFLY